MDVNIKKQKPKCGGNGKKNEFADYNGNEEK